MTQNSAPALANTQLRLAVDLTGTGTERRSAKESARAAIGKSTSGTALPTTTSKAFDVRVLLEQVQLAQDAAFDFVAIGDSFVLDTNGVNPRAGQIDAALITSRIAPVLNGIGLIPAINTTHTEPFHVSKLVATLDHISNGHGGWEPTVSTTKVEAQLFGRGPALSKPAAWSQAGEVIDVVAQLWDSWEDDAEIRDERTGRFIDRNKLHYVDYEGVHFSVKGPSITPRPPQGHPITVISIPAASTDDASQEDTSQENANLTAQIIEIAAQHAQVVRLNVDDIEKAIVLRAALKERAVAHGRVESDILVYVNVLAIVSADHLSAQIRRDFLEESHGSAFANGAFVFAGTPRELAALGKDWLTAGATDGFVLKPASLSTDLRAITEHTVPVLTANRLFAPAYRGETLRDQLGLAKPKNRFAQNRRTDDQAPNLKPAAALSINA